MKIFVCFVLPLVAGFALNGKEDELACSNAYKTDGGWGEWSKWSICSMTCDAEGVGGIQVRHRECSNPIARYGGKECEGKTEEVKSGCNADIKCPVDGGWGEWKMYGGCSVTCGEGTIEFFRQCDQPRPEHCGQKCSGPETMVKACRAIDCPTTPPPTITTTPPPVTTTPPPVTTTSPPEPSMEACSECFEKANQNGRWWDACRTDASECESRKNDKHIRHMYAAKGWFFLHCAPDGNWCKPCAVPSLVYNPTCGQCERSRDGPCTGPQNWV